ncbi:hypothetical protein EYF80_037914 [Liparis tanakae]|uniref:Secreted protein n=1 Tax=Liparis tanakae TaxID=230148 RepID=A0A4Z2GEB6_9TELE|nr:hypothetical protein EYF80_037914 [Liparis tanakae]
MVLQLLLSITSLRCFLRLLVLGSHGDPLEGKACGSGSGRAFVGPLGSVLLLNGDADVVVVVVLGVVRGVAGPPLARGSLLGRDRGESMGVTQLLLPVLHPASMEEHCELCRE